jgi:hypothetical protein
VPPATDSRKKGRGPLNSIELLPRWARPAVERANAALAKREETALEIHERFNAELRTLAFENGVVDPPQISLSAFNRVSMRLAAHAHRLEDTREIATVLASRLEDGGDESLTLMAAETIKTIVFEALENAGQIGATALSAEMMANFALALKSAEQTKKITADVKLMVAKNIAKVAEEAIDRVAQQKGLSPEVKKAFMAEVLGVRAA